ncbi:MAG: hypothetical protein KatS3mg031_1602 [Chitinophagales bacterium]|nr:MAG: hypothetical protein KatS3mg031_1602 [Chitinophagales bacterium]
MLAPALWVCAGMFPLCAFPQDVYRLQYQTDIPLGAVGLGTATASFVIGMKASKPTPEQVQALDKQDIWVIDRHATQRWSPPAAIASDVFLYTGIAMPALLFINKNVRREKYVSLMYAETLLMTMGVTNIVKVLTKRYRPFAYNPAVAMDKRTEKDARKSFFSGHTSLTASASFFMARVYCDLNPDSRLKPLVWTSAALLPAIVGMLRYLAGKHYPTDILAGYVTGAGIGFLVPYLHKKKELRP